MKATHRNSTILAGAACTGLLVLIGLQAYAAAIVGKPRKVDIANSTATSRSLEELKAEYRRPTSIPFPPDNPYTVEKALLGKKLYFDPRLSSGNLLSCASCHNPAFGWGDGQPRAVGHAMKVLGRRSPTIIDAAWRQALMWDGRATSLEAQALGPITTDTEMNMPLDRLIGRLSNIEQYRLLFAAAFPDKGITAASIAKALATYERSIVSDYAPFDGWIDGDDIAISASAKRGFELFNTKARCSQCHSGWSFTDDSFHDIGLESADLGRGKFFPNSIKMHHAFKTPTLREVARRGPFMHDGTLPTLEAVVDHYDRGGAERPSRSDAITPLGLTPEEKAELVAFLKTLTGIGEQTTVPILPREFGQF